MLRPGFPRLSHPGLAHAIPSIAFIAQVYRGETCGFAHDLGGEGDRSTATGANTKQAANQIEEKYDWALTTDLRPLDYASRHFDEPGAHEAAKEILASRPDADPQCHSN